MPTPPTPPTYWWLTVRIDACRTRDQRVAAASGDDAIRMWRELHPNLEVIHVRPVPELVDIELEHMSINNNNNNNTDPIRGVPPLLAARAALAEPVTAPAGPTDEELREVWCDGWNTSEEWGALEFARAVLAIWGHYSPDATKMVGPAAGEAGELASLIREAVRAWVAWEEGAVMLNNMTEVQLTRAADLLEQLSSGSVVPTVEQFAPVPVSERLPGPRDCDAEGRCWWWYPPVPEQNYGYWIYEDNAVPERSRLEWPDSWLPANALPLPKEVEK